MVTCSIELKLLDKNIVFRKIEGFPVFKMILSSFYTKNCSVVCTYVYIHIHLIDIKKYMYY